MTHSHVDAVIGKSKKKIGALVSLCQLLKLELLYPLRSHSSYIMKLINPLISP